MYKTEEEKAFSVCIGARLARLRAEKKNTKKALAYYLGLSVKQIRNYEKGRSEISFFNLIKICSFFYVPIVYFMSEDEEEQAMSYDALVRNFIFRINEIDIEKTKLFLMLRNEPSGKK